MSKIIRLNSFSDKRGSLTVIEKCLPFDIKRVYYIYNAKVARGGHAHKATFQAMVAVNGSCIVRCLYDNIETIYELDKPDDLLMLNPDDWHEMYGFSEDCVLLVLASEYYNENDYID